MSWELGLDIRDDIILANFSLDGAGPLVELRTPCEVCSKLYANSRCHLIKWFTAYHVDIGASHRTSFAVAS